MFQAGVGSEGVGVAGGAHTMALGTIQKRNRARVCVDDGGQPVSANGWGWWFFLVCVRQDECVSCVHVTVCSYISVAKQEVCGVKVAWRKLDVVHKRQNFTSKTTKNVTPHIWQIQQHHHHIPHYGNRKSPLMWPVLIKGCECHFLPLHLQRGHVQQTGRQVLSLFWQPQI